MATSPYYVSQYTPQHMTEEEQIQEAIRLSLGDSGSSEREPDVFLPCDLSSYADYSAVRSFFEVPTILQKLAYRIPTQDDLPDPDVIQSAINRAKKSFLGPSVSDLESVSRMLFSDFGVDLEEEINCDGDEAKGEEVVEVVELEDDADDVTGNHKEGCRLQFGRSKVHYTKVHAREIDISKIVSGPPERELYGYPLSRYYQPLNKTLRNVEHKRKMTREDKKFCQLMLLRIPLSENSLSVETPQRLFVSPPPVSTDYEESNVVGIRAVSLQGSKSSAGPRLGTKRDGSSDAETQAGPKRLCVTTSETDLSCVKRKYSSLTEGVQVDQKLVASDLTESLDNEPIEVNKEILQPSPKKMRLIEQKVESTAVGCNAMILEAPQSIDLPQDANDDVVVESKNQHSHFSKKNLNIFLAVLENKQMQPRKRMESAEINHDGSSLSGEFSISNNIEHISINSPSSHCKEAIINGDETSVNEAEESPLARKVAYNEHFFEDLIVGASPLPVGQEEAFQNGVDVVAGACAKSSSSRPSLRAAREALETLINKKLSVGTQKVGANRRCKLPERLRRPPCKSTEWNEQLQSVKFRTQPQVLSAGFPAMLVYSPYHRKLFNEMDLKEKVDSSVACIKDEYKVSELAVPREQLKAPAVGRTGLLTGSPNGLSHKETVAESSIVKKPIEGTIMEDIKAGPSGYNLRELNDDSAPPDDKLAVFNTNDFLKSYFDIVLKWWVVNVSKRLIFPNYPSDRATCPILPRNGVLQNIIDCTTIWRFFASNLDQITNTIKKTEKFLDTKNQQLEPTTQSLLMNNKDYHKTSQFIKDMLKYMHEQYGLSEAIEYESHEATPMIQQRREAPSSFSEFETKSCIDGDYEDVLLGSSSSTWPNYSEKIHLMKVHHYFTGVERGHSTMHMAIFTQGDLKRPPLDKKSPRCSTEDSNQKRVLTTSEINFGLEILSITPKRPGSPDSAFESQGSNDDCVDTSVSDKSNRGSAENVSHIDNEKLSPLLNKLQFEDRVFLSTEFRQSALCSNDGEIDTTKDEPLKEKILDWNTRCVKTYTNPSNSSHCTPLKYSRFLSETPYHSFSDPNITAVSESVSDREKSGIKYEQSSNPVGNVVVAPLNIEITKELHIDCGYASDKNMVSKSIHRVKSNSLSSKDLSSGSESSSDEESTTSHFSEVATRLNSLGYPSQYSDGSFDEINADGEEFVSCWSSYVGKSSLYQNITEAEVFSGPYKLLKYFEVSCFGHPIITQSVTPDVFLTVKDQEKRYTISRHNPFVHNNITQPDALSLTEMVQMAAKLGCFHGIGLAFQRLNGHGFMAQFRHTMRTGLFREADFIKAATAGLTNFIETHYNDVSKRQFLDYLGRQFGKGIPTTMNYLLAPHNDIDMKFWTLTVGDVTPRNIVVHKTKQTCDPKVLRWNKSRIGNCFLDLVSLLVTLPDPRCKEVQVLSTLLSYLSALGETFLIFNIQYPLYYHAIIMSIRKAAMLLIYQFMAEEDTYRGPTEQDKLYGMVWNAALFATDPDQVNWDCPWKEKDPCPLGP